MEGFQFLCRSDELADGEFREVAAVVNDLPSHLIATRYRGRAQAWLNICPHQGRPLNWAPGRFLVDERGNLVCAAHGAVFEPEQGVCVAGPCLRAMLSAVDIDEHDGKIFYNPYLNSI